MSAQIDVFAWWREGLGRRFATVQNEGSRLVSRIIEYYNLDMIISVGFRVKSERGIHFRQWANRILKEYLLKGYSINNRVSRLEERVSKTEGQIDFFIKSSLPPLQGVFFNGQIFDAYRFVSDHIRRAKCSIALIDNYVDDSVLSLLDKRGSDVSATVYTRQISSQYPKKHLPFLRGCFLGYAGYQYVTANHRRSGHRWSLHR